MCASRIAIMHPLFIYLFLRLYTDYNTLSVLLCCASFRLWGASSSESCSISKIRFSLGFLVCRISWLAAIARRCAPFTNVQLITQWERKTKFIRTTSSKMESFCWKVNDIYCVYTLILNWKHCILITKELLFRLSFIIIDIIYLKLLYHRFYYNKLKTRLIL